MFTVGQVVEFIEKAFGSSTPSNQWLNVSVVCPRCAEREVSLAKRKLVIRTDDWLTHCWVCHYRSTNLVHLLSKYKPWLVEEYKERFNIQSQYQKEPNHDLAKLFSEEENEIITTSTPTLLPSGFTLIATNLEKKNNRSVIRAWIYLDSRGITRDDLWYWKFGISDHKPLSKEEKNFRGRVIIPSFDNKGNLNYFSSRMFWKIQYGSKYLNPDTKRESIIFNEINIDWSEELTITEGAFDLVKCNDNATCLLGSTLDSSYLLFQRIVENRTPVLLALDSDAIAKTIAIAKTLVEHDIPVRIHKLPPKIKDVGELTKKQFLDGRIKANSFSMKDFFIWKLTGELP